MKYKIKSIALGQSSCRLRKIDIGEVAPELNHWGKPSTWLNCILFTLSYKLGPCSSMYYICYASMTKACLCLCYRGPFTIDGVQLTNQHSFIGVKQIIAIHTIRKYRMHEQFYSRRINDKEQRILSSKKWWRSMSNARWYKKYLNKTAIKRWIRNKALLSSQKNTMLLHTKIKQFAIYTCIKMNCTSSCQTKMLNSKAGRKTIPMRRISK